MLALRRGKERLRMLAIFGIKLLETFKEDSPLLD